MSRELHDALHRVEEFEQNERTVRTEEKEWQDKQQSNAAATEEELIQVLTVLPMLLCVYLRLSTYQLCKKQPTKM